MCYSSHSYMNMFPTQFSYEYVLSIIFLVWKYVIQNIFCMKVAYITHFLCENLLSNILFCMKMCYITHFATGNLLSNKFSI